PKVYLIQADDAWSAFVSSGNFTQGGLEGNVEMSLHIQDQDTCLDLLKWFETYYRLGTPLSEKWISDYRLLYQRRQANLARDRNDIREFKLKTSQQVKHKQLEDFDFEGQFFQRDHHAAFSGQKPYLSTPEAVRERALVQDRLLDLHAQLWPTIEQWNLHHHHKPAYITSSVEHSQYTDAALGAVWLHYGRSKPELKQFEAVYGPNQSSMYHMRLQVLVREMDVAVWLRVGKPNGTIVDRKKFKERMDANEEDIRERFHKLVASLPESYHLGINGGWESTAKFTTSEALHDYVQQDSIHAHYFIIGREYTPDDSCISEQRMAATVLEDFERLLPLYKLIRTPPPTPPK
ncbi:MAG: phospholipase D family protein, partial [Bacteroidota bacterium]